VEFAMANDSDNLGQIQQNRRNTQAHGKIDEHILLANDEVFQRRRIHGRLQVNNIMDG
jgi:hypothetical protein